MKKLKSILSRVLDVDESIITDSTSPDSVDSWDSFNGLMLVSELESNFDVTFTTDEVIGVKTVGDIKKVLIKHGVTLVDD